MPDAAIADASCAREFSDLIRYYGLVPKRVCLEVLEHASRDELELAEAASVYRESGISLAMDDFGTACSNFDRIAALRPELVKVERSMLAQAVGDRKSRGLMIPLFDLLREAGAQIVVERIESANEALMAIDAGATFLQGNYLAPPAVVLERDEFSAAMVRKLLTVGAPRVAVGAD
jgi:EAL domain-containing protein (putative c-di-GMP-specific phosphodiesterase class I)